MVRGSLAGWLCAGALTAAAAGCGAASAQPVPGGCEGPAAPIEQALRAAPGPVLLGGVPLSGCVARATGQSDLLAVAASFLAVTDDLARRRTPAAALELGYLIGATDRGGAHLQGTASVFVARMRETAPVGSMSAELRSALARGLRAGQRGG